MVCLILLFACESLFAQNKKARVLFIGNSYTHVNNLPQLVADMAASTGDTLEYDMSAPGGATLNYHYVFITATREKIRTGRWDYVVLQEQSQVPATSPPYFYDWVYRFAKLLVEDVKLHNPCGETIFYMTWGRKNGDLTMCPRPIGWPYFCYYHTMDSVLRARYMLMADSNRAAVSPVGPVWRYIRVNHPDIELYDVDESHPSTAGSYAAACSFYTAIFKKPATLVTYNFSLSSVVASNIRMAASKVAYDSLNFWSIGRYETIAGFTHNADQMLRVSFTNKSANAIQYNWDFGDRQTSTRTDPVHTYASKGIYTVRLISTGTSCRDTAYARINITNGPDASFTISPNPVNDILFIKSALFGRDNYYIRVLNILGQPVYERLATSAETQAINVTGLPAGVYTVSIYTTRRIIYRKKIIMQ